MTTYTYTVFTQHGAERTERRKDFTGPNWWEVADAAVAYAKSFTPLTDGSVCPNVDDDYLTHPGYSSSVFDHRNRYAAIICTGPIPNT